jgi:hypothetical protein
VQTTCPSSWTVLAQVSRAQSTGWAVLVPFGVTTHDSAWHVREQVEADAGSAWNVFYRTEDVTLDVTGPTQQSTTGTLTVLSTVGTLSGGKIISGKPSGATVSGDITQRGISGSGPTDR